MIKITFNSKTQSGVYFFDNDDECNKFLSNIRDNHVYYNQRNRDLTNKLTVKIENGRTNS